MVMNVWQMKGSHCVAHSAAEAARKKLEEKYGEEAGFFVFLPDITINFSVFVLTTSNLLLTVLWLSESQELILWHGWRRFSGVNPGSAAILYHPSQVVKLCCKI